jgi:Glycosyl hydrolase family 71
MSHALLRSGRTPGPDRPTANRRRLTRLATLVAVPAAAAAALAPTVGATAATAAAPAAAPAAAAATGTPQLPFDLPAKATLRASGKKVFANWVTSLPISLDNKAPSSDYYQRNYMSPTGEGGKHKAYGGYMRDRPLGRAPRAGNWKLEDMKTEVRQAISEGIDGFTMVVYTLPAPGKSDRMWDNAKLMMQAAAAVDPGFKIIPMPDTSGGSKLKFVDAGTMSRRMAELGRYSSAYKIGGRMVLSPFTAENRTPAWWKSVTTSMAKSGVPVNFFPLFQNEQVQRDRFKAISYGMANWGTRNPKWTNPSLTTGTSPVGRIGKIHALGRKWMQPVSVQDFRPREGIYWEAENTTNLRNSWAIALKGKADWAQVTTWNDLPEGSGMLPSTNHGFSFLDINAYYLTWFKTGRAPTIKRDAIYLTHRKQSLAAKPTFRQTKLMRHGGGAPGRNTVEALTFAKAPGTVRVVVGSKSYSCAVKTGVNVCTFPLGVGKVSAKLVRSGATTTSITSPYTVLARPLVQDFQYVGVSSLRKSGSATPAPQPTPGPTAAPATTTRTLAPAADGYANQGAPTVKFGTSSSLAAQGRPAATAYLKFTLPKAPAGKTLRSASLKVRTTNNAVAGSATAQSLRLAGNGWTEAGLTWNNRPAATGATLGSLTGRRANTAYSAALSATALRSQLGKQVTVAVTGNGADGLWFWSRQHANPGYRPQLVLKFG